VPLDFMSLLQSQQAFWHDFADPEAGEKLAENQPFTHEFLANGWPSHVSSVKPVGPGSGNYPLVI